MSNAKFQPRAFVNDEIFAALDALRNGNFAYRMPMNVAGNGHKVARLFNEIMEMNVAMATELERIREQVTARGAIPSKANIPGAAGSWVACLGAINALVDRLGHPVPDALSAG